MATNTEAERERTISPEEAFSVLGDETRLQILRTLGEADGPLAFSELYERIEYDDTANFNYHLTKLVGHFVRETDEGYTLRRAGSRIVEAVLSGAVTDNPTLDRVPVDMPCPLCGGSMEISYREGSIIGYCQECGGTRGGSNVPRSWPTESTDDIVGQLRLPPAGLQGRTPTELLEAAEIWSAIQGRAVARGVCHSCSAPIKEGVRVCDDHDSSDGRCEACDQRFRVTVHRSCTNCILEWESPFGQHLLADTDVMGFMIDHGIDPLAPGGFHLAALDETILSTDPFEARFTFTTDGDAIALTVDDDLSVVDVTRTGASETASE
jgi:DNA-binding transcriptional ArsR family regulator